MALEILKLFLICLGNRDTCQEEDLVGAALGRVVLCNTRVIILKLNDVNVWAGFTRYFGAKQRIIHENYSTVHIMVCNVMLKKE